MRSIVLFLIIFFTLTLSGFSQTQPFSLVSSPLSPLEFSSGAWGDYDNDGDLDVILSGSTGTAPSTWLYRNDNGSFTEVNSGLPGFSNTSVEWGDFDHDGDLDLLFTGLDMNHNDVTKIFKNIDGNFTDANIILPGISNGQATWGDFDNDGDLDILLAGSFKTKILMNNGNDQFSEISTPLVPLQNASCSWVDYNNDGQLDAMINGDSGGGMVSKLYKNSHGVFHEVLMDSSAFMGLGAGCCKWADLDNDGKQDLVLAGMDINADGHLVVYKNEGNDHFTLFDAITNNVRYSSLDIGDYNADGYSDIIFIGKINGCGGTAVTMLFQNLGFMQFFEVNTPIAGFCNGRVNWGDFNNDGFTDLLLTGTDGYEAPKTAIYKNNLGTGVFTTNTPPTIPEGLMAESFPDKIIIHWNSALDLQTPKNGLSYNLYVGTQPGISDIVPAMANETTGFRRIVSVGNCTADTSCTISGIPAGDYWFSVQAIDNGLLPGNFATPVAFSYDPMGMKEHNSSTLSIHPNPCREMINIQIPDGEAWAAERVVRIYNQAGRLVFEGMTEKPINTSTWPKGIYLVCVTRGDHVNSDSLLIKE
ncbi:MAG: FG-GAP-like repeat-containing protein [Bacteroidales bacterium]|nr:FG-GAP-like repeat-containing protein [Bacteroidales bacterium]